MTFVLSAIWLVTALYVCFMLAYTVGWHRQKEYSPTASTASNTIHRVSVVIPLRNEAHNLPTLIASLKNQTYPNVEVLLVNDHSTDSTQSLIFGLNDSRFIPLNSPETSKKAALKCGIEHAGGTLILTTDADAIIPPTWVQTMVQAFFDRQTHLLIGPVTMQHGVTWQQIEHASLEGTTLGSAGIGLPVLCSGANLAFTPQWFQACAPYLKPHVPSGDDMFMLQATILLKGQVRALKSTTATVGISGEPTLKQFFTQRARWAGKATHYTAPSILCSATVVGLMQVAVVVSLALSVLYPFLLCTLLCKFVIDTCLVASVLTYHKKVRYVWYMPLLTLLYPFYALGVCIMSLFPVSWKNRNVSSF